MEKGLSCYLLSGVEMIDHKVVCCCFFFKLQHALLSALTKDGEGGVEVALPL